MDLCPQAVSITRNDLGEAVTGHITRSKEAWKSSQGRAGGKVSVGLHCAQDIPAQVSQCIYELQFIRWPAETGGSCQSAKGSVLPLLQTNEAAKKHKHNTHFRECPKHWVLRSLHVGSCLALLFGIASAYI